MNISTQTYVISLLVSGLLTTATLLVAGYMLREIARKGKVRVIWWDPNAKRITVSFHDRKNGRVTVGKGEQARTFILEGDAVHGGDYPTVAIHPEHGWNFKPDPALDRAKAFFLRGPTNAETVDRDVKLATLSVSNPKSYHKAMARHEWSDALDANDEKENLWVKNAPVLMMGLVIVVAMLLGGLGYVAYKVSTAAAGAGGA